VPQCGDCLHQQCSILLHPFPPLPSLRTPAAGPALAPEQQHADGQGGMASGNYDEEEVETEEGGAGGGQECVKFRMLMKRGGKDDRTRELQVGEGNEHGW